MVSTGAAPILVLRGVDPHQRFHALNLTKMHRTSLLYETPYEEFS